MAIQAGSRGRAMTRSRMIIAVLCVFAALAAVTATAPKDALAFGQLIV
jgi:hypothetical protein